MKKILICDHKNTLEPNYDRTISALNDTLCEDFTVEVYAYENKTDLYERLTDIDGLITAFLEVDEELLEHAPNLKCISVSAVGYGNIDCKAAVRHGVKVCHIEEYCTEEVAEHTFALMGALNRNLKYYNNQIEGYHKWEYHSISGGHTLSNKTLAIWGYGKIGRRVAKIARGYDMRVIAVDPHTEIDKALKEGVEIVSALYALKEADIISNHMNLTSENKHYFNREIFLQMAKNPIFLNVGRGACVNEEDLVWALENGVIAAAGLDVLEDEEPDLARCKLVGRDNVILTPHSAFYSDDSLEALQRISGENLGYFLSGKEDRVYSVVRECR